MSNDYSRGGERMFAVGLPVGRDDEGVPTIRVILMRAGNEDEARQAALASIGLDLRVREADAESERMLREHGVPESPVSASQILRATAKREART